jgi:hypothetical protein
MLIEKNHKLNAAFQLYCEAKRVQEKLRDLLRCYAELYGEDGPVISGGFYDNWPDSAKEEVRALNRRYNDLMDGAERNRPKYVRWATMRALIQEAEQYVQASL